MGCQPYPDGLGALQECLEADRLCWGGSMSGIMGWLPEWMAVLLAAIVGVSVFTLVESFVKKKIRERNKKESQQQKSNPENLSAKLGGLAVVQVRSANDERDQYRTEADEKAKELTKLRSDFKAFKQKHGLWRVQVCGFDNSPIGLSVVVQFIAPRDSGLAERILGFFVSARPIFKTNDIEPIMWFRNPSSNSRIVIFSNHPNAGGIKAAFKNCDLLEEPVDKFEMSFAGTEQAAFDIAIVVFPTDSSED